MQKKNINKIKTNNNDKYQQIGILRKAYLFHDLYSVSLQTALSMRFMILKIVHDTISLYPLPYNSYKHTPFDRNSL